MLSLCAIATGSDPRSRVPPVREGARVGLAVSHTRGTTTGAPVVEEALDGEARDAGLHREVDPAHLGLHRVLREGREGEEGDVAQSTGGDRAVDHLLVLGARGELVGDEEAGGGLRGGDAEELPGGLLRG